MIVHDYVDSIPFTPSYPETPAKANTIITAPSGCGKTETFRAIRDYFRKHNINLPIYQYDMIKLGATEELLGRFPVIVNYKKLYIEHKKNNR